LVSRAAGLIDGAFDSSPWVACLEVSGPAEATLDDVQAIGQAPDISFLSEDSRIERSLWGSLEVDENRLATNVPGVFSGGDFITGPSTVIQAIASGRRAALAIDKYLLGDTNRIHIRDEKTAMNSSAGLALDEQVTGDMPREAPDMEPPETRSRDFREVEKGLSEEQARREAGRCLRCDLEKELSES
jgi:NADH-quinone oxidoreductase subunit F